MTNMVCSRHSTVAGTSAEDITSSGSLDAISDTLSGRSLQLDESVDAQRLVSVTAEED